MLSQSTSTFWAPPCVPWHVSRNRAGGAKLQRLLAEMPVTGSRGGAGRAAQPAAPLRHEMASPGTAPDYLQETLSPQDSKYRPSRRRTGRGVAADPAPGSDRAP